MGALSTTVDGKELRGPAGGTVYGVDRGAGVCRVRGAGAAG